MEGMIKVITNVTVTFCLCESTFISKCDIHSIFQKMIRIIKFNKPISTSPIYTNFSGAIVITATANIDFFL